MRDLLIMSKSHHLNQAAAQMKMFIKYSVQIPIRRQIKSSSKNQYKINLKVYQNVLWHICQMLKI